MDQKEALGVTVGLALVGEVNFLVVFVLFRDGDEFITRACSNLYDRFNTWSITIPS
jgi:hypothetical protein